MSMFDTVRISCKGKHCYNVLEVQTKAGPCIDKVWTLDELLRKGRLKLLTEINKKEIHCNSCGNDWRIQLDLRGIDINLIKLQEYENGWNI